MASRLWACAAHGESSSYSQLLVQVEMLPERMQVLLARLDGMVRRPFCEGTVYKAVPVQCCHPQMPEAAPVPSLHAIFLLITAYRSGASARRQTWSFT